MPPPRLARGTIRGSQCFAPFQTRMLPGTPPSVGRGSLGRMRENWRHLFSAAQRRQRSSQDGMPAPRLGGARRPSRGLGSRDGTDPETGGGFHDSVHDTSSLSRRAKSRGARDSTKDQMGNSAEYPHGTIGNNRPVRTVIRPYFLPARWPGRSTCWAIADISVGFSLICFGFRASRLPFFFAMREFLSCGACPTPCSNETRCALTSAAAALCDATEESRQIDRVRREIPGPPPLIERKCGPGLMACDEARPLTMETRR
jgi:hypothetical protein